MVNVLPDLLCQLTTRTLAIKVECSYKLYSQVELLTLFLFLINSYFLAAVPASTGKDLGRRSDRTSLSGVHADSSWTGGF